MKGTTCVIFYQGLLLWFYDMVLQHHEVFSLEVNLIDPSNFYFMLEIENLQH